MWQNSIRRTARDVISRSPAFAVFYVLSLLIIVRRFFDAVLMTHVVTNNCRNCRFTECVASCPVSCFHANEVRVYIDPRRCTDCGACIPVCPVDAIVREMDIEADQEHWIEINAKAVRRYQPIREKQNPLPEAELQRAKYGFA